MNVSWKVGDGENRDLGDGVKIPFFKNKFFSIFSIFTLKKVFLPRPPNPGFPCHPNPCLCHLLSKMFISQHLTLLVLDFLIFDLLLLLFFLLLPYTILFLALFLKVLHNTSCHPPTHNTIHLILEVQF